MRCVDSFPTKDDVGQARRTVHDSGPCNPMTVEVFRLACRSMDLRCDSDVLHGRLTQPMPAYDSDDPKRNQVNHGEPLDTLFPYYSI